MDDLLPRLMAILSTTPLRWNQMAGTIPLDLLSQQPAPGEWSAVECLQHLIDTEGIFQSRMSAFREGRDFPAFNPDSEGTQRKNPSAQDMAAEFTRRRAESLRLLENITPSDFNLRARHAELGTVTLEQMLNEWAAHDLNHSVQAERALMQPFLRGCGPWITYFTDHLIVG